MRTAICRSMIEVLADRSNTRARYVALDGVLDWISYPERVSRTGECESKKKSMRNIILYNRASHSALSAINRSRFVANSAAIFAAEICANIIKVVSHKNVGGGSDRLLKRLSGISFQKECRKKKREREMTFCVP